MSINTVVFDYGGVLTLPPRNEHLTKIAELLQLTPAEVRWRTGQFRRIYDRGSIDAAEYWRLMSGSSEPISDETINALVSLDVDSWTQENMDTIELVRELKNAGLTVGILSNMQADCLAYIRRRFEWLSLFDGAVYSCELELTKPDPKIYHYTLELLGVHAESAVFIDDTWENVEAARRIGMGGIQFESAAELRRVLTEYLPGQLAGS